MAYVITDNCIKDLLCVDVCAADSIHLSRMRRISPAARKC
jgi:hypothetical protein